MIYWDQNVDRPNLKIIVYAEISYVLRWLLANRLSPNVNNVFHSIRKYATASKLYINDIEVILSHF